MNPDEIDLDELIAEEAMPSIKDLRRSGAHVLELAPVEIEGSTEEPVGPRGSGTAPVEAITEFFSTLPERARSVPLVGEALGDWLDAGTAGTDALAQAGSLNLADEIEGAGHALREADERDDLLDALTGGDIGALERLRSDYRGGRDAARTRTEEGAEEHPLVAGLGTGAGILGTLPFMPSLGMPARVGAGARIGMGIGEGAIYGGAAGFGGSEGDLGTEEGRSRLLDDTGEGILIGGVGGGLGAGLAEGVGAAGRGLARYGRGADRARVAATIAGPGTPLSTATERRLETLGRAIGGTDDPYAPLAEAIRRPRGDAAGDFAVSTIAGTGDDALERLERAREASGRRVGEFNDRVDAATGGRMPAERFDRAISEALGEYAPDVTLGAESSRRTLTDMAGDVAGGAVDGGVSTAALRDYLNRMNGRANRTIARDVASDALERAEATSSGTRALRGAYDEIAEEAAPDIAGAYRPARHDYAAVSALTDAAEDAARRRARSGPSLTSRLAAGAERSGGGSILGSETVGRVYAEGRARLPAIEASAREAARSAAPAVSRSRASARGSRGAGLGLEEMLGGPPTVHDAEIGDVTVTHEPDDFGFLPDDDFGFTPDERSDAR